MFWIIINRINKNIFRKTSKNGTIKKYRKILSLKACIRMIEKSVRLSQVGISMFQLFDLIFNNKINWKKILKKEFI